MLTYSAVTITGDAFDGLGVSVGDAITPEIVFPRRTGQPCQQKNKNM